MSGWGQRHEDSVELHLTYNLAAIATLKAQIPHSARQWNPDGKFWVVFEPFVDAAIRLLSAQVGPLRIADLRRPRVAPIVRGDWAAELFDALPDHLRQPVYRALVKVLHPDVGGDTALAQRLNDVFGQQRAS